MTSLEGTRPPIEDTRRRHLVEVTIDSLAELGYVARRLRKLPPARACRRLVAHYSANRMVCSMRRFARWRAAWANQVSVACAR